MSDYDDRPLISSQDTAPPSFGSSGNGSDSSGEGCMGCLWSIGKLFLIILAISWVITRCSGGDSKSDDKKTPPQSATQESVISEGGTSGEAQPSQQAEDSLLSQRARVLELLMFHGFYTDLGTVEIHDFDKRDVLLEKMATWVDEIGTSAVHVKYEKHLFSPGYYTVTDEQNDIFAPGDTIYIGDTKWGHPDGWGVIMELAGDNAAYEFIGEPVIVYAGEFDDGKYDGYGVKFFASDLDITPAVQDAAKTGLVADEDGELLVEYLFNHVNYEGYFSDNERDGKGNEFNFFSYYDGCLYLPNNDPIDGYIFANAYPDVTMGEYEGDELNGDAKVYKHNRLVYEGEMKNGRYHGKGTSYTYDGRIEYKGKWKKGEPDD